MQRSADLDERARALDDIASIARRHGLSAIDIAAALGEAGTPREHRWRRLLVGALGVLGGLFVFAGVGAFVALQWDHMNSAARVVATFGPGLTAFVLAVLSSREARFEKARTPLFLMAAALEPTGMLVAFDEFGTGGDWRWAGLITSCAVAIQFGAAFGAVRRSTPLFVSLAFATAFWWTAFDLLEIDHTVTAIALGATMLSTAAGIDRTRHAEITPLWYLGGGTAFFYGLFDAVDRTPFELIFLGVAAGFVYVSAVLHSRTLLVVSSLAILAYTGWFTGQHFVDSIGWPVALVAFGAFMMGLSALVFRIDRDYVRRSGNKAV
jgi:hypothetical protein